MFRLLVVSFPTLFPDWCANKSYVIATSDLWLFIHASSLPPLLPTPLPYRWLRGQPKGGVTEGIPGLRPRPRGCRWCRWLRPEAVTTLWERWYPPHHCGAATRSQWKLTTPHRRPNPGHCPSPDSSGAVVPTLLRRRCWNGGNDQLLSRSTWSTPTATRRRRPSEVWLGHKLQALVYDSCVTQWCYALFDYAYRDGRPAGPWFIDRLGGSR